MNPQQIINRRQVDRARREIIVEYGKCGITARREHFDRGAYLEELGQVPADVGQLTKDYSRKTPLESMVDSRHLAIRLLGVSCVVTYSYAQGAQEKIQNELFKRIKI